MARLSPVAKYYAYVGTQAAWFTTPIWNVFLLANGFSYTQLGFLNSAWWAATVLGEVPTGYVADRIGRRNSLLVGALTHVGCVLVFGLLNTFWPILAIYTVWGIGHTFRSGSESAWLYDTLADRMDEDRFAHVKGRGTSVSLVVAGLSALVGGWLYGLDPYFPFAAAGVATGVGAVVAATIPTSDTYADSDPVAPREAFGVIRETLDQHALRWFVPATVVLIALGWTVGVFIQPVSEDILTGAGVAAERVPTLLGAIYASFTAASAVVTFKSGAIREWVGVERWMRLAPFGLGAVYVASFLFPVLALPAFVARRVVLSATAVFRDAYVNERTETAGRATVLSAVAMALGLARIPVRIGVGAVADATSPLAAVALVGGLLVAAAVAIWTRSPSDAPAREAVSTD